MTTTEVSKKIKETNTPICKLSPQEASPGIEPGSGASETLILSIVLRGRLIQQSTHIRCEYLNGDGQQNYTKEFSYSQRTCRTKNFGNIV